MISVILYSRYQIRQKFICQQVVYSVSPKSRPSKTVCDIFSCGELAATLGHMVYTKWRRPNPEGTISCQTHSLKALICEYIIFSQLLPNHMSTVYQF